MEMIPCVGTKFISAKRMTLGEYNAYRGWTMPGGEDPNEKGYLVEYKDGGKPNDPRHTGYISWSPKGVFEISYRSLNKGVPFSMALESLQVGRRITRQGWNGKGMYLYLVGEGRYPPSTVAGRKIAEHHKDGLVPYRPYIAMFTVDQDVVPWVASQSDLLMDDWLILD